MMRWVLMCYLWQAQLQTRDVVSLEDRTSTLLNRLYGVWQCELFNWYFRFQNTCNRNKFVWISCWIAGFYITKSCKERHWTPFYPPNTLRGREYHFPVFCVNFLINSAQKHPYIKQHTLLSQKWLLWISWSMYNSIILTDNSRNTIFYRKVIAIENWFYLHEKLVIKRVFSLKLLTLVYFKHVFYNCKISKHVIFSMHGYL